MNNHVVRGDTMTRDVREEWRADDRFIVEMTNISHNDLKNGVSVGGFSHYLAEGGTDVKEVPDIEIIFISTTDEGTVRKGGLEDVIVDTNVLHKFGLLLAVRWAVEGADDNLLNGSR